MSMRPGMRNMPRPSMRRASAGTGVLPAGPTAAIRPSRTTTVAFSQRPVARHGENGDARDREGFRVGPGGVGRYHPHAGHGREQQGRCDGHGNLDWGIDQLEYGIPYEKERPLSVRGTDGIPAGTPGGILSRRSMISKPAPVAVIGAGVAGLSAAYHLAEAGRRVVVLEAQERVGGTDPDPVGRGTGGRVHSRPPEGHARPAAKAHIERSPLDGEHWQLVNGRLRTDGRTTPTTCASSSRWRAGSAAIARWRRSSTRCPRIRHGAKRRPGCATSWKDSTRPTPPSRASRRS